VIDPPTPVVAVGGVAVVEGALLLVRRTNAPEAGRWSLPGGRVDPGEAVTAAVIRELREETALEVRCGELLGWAERRGDDYHYVILDFEVTTVGRGTPQAGSDATEVAWVPLGDVAALDLVAGLEEFLRRHAVLG
jgi:acetyl-CoA carboxylase carboxyl transferase subunit beta